MDKQQFTIKGKRDLTLFRMNGTYMCYDSIGLEYYSIDKIGAEILYCISKRMKLDQIIEVLQEQYEVDTETCRTAIIDFLESSPLLPIFYHNLIQNDLYLEMKPFKVPGAKP